MTDSVFGSRNAASQGLRLAVAATALGRRGDTAASRAFLEQAGVPEDADPARTRDAAAALASVLGATDALGAADAALEAADALIAGAAGLDAGLVHLADPRYPPWLAQIPDPPLALWVRGRTEPFGDTMVAMVGSRNATPTGLAVARKLAAGLAEAGIVVVSGLARGIDAAAHQGTLDAGGRTIGVLGCGIDVTYPRGHGALGAEIAREGAVLSEFLPGTSPLPAHFPLRNRIISGMARAVVVVEASERSGSLITARLALEQGRDVLAVPGGVASGHHRGCHALIKDGATLVETVGDILDEIGVAPARAGVGVDRGNLLPMNDLEALMAAGEPYTVDDLALRAGRPVRDLLAALSRLEIAGRVVRAAGGSFVRLDGSAMDRRQAGDR